MRYFAFGSLLTAVALTAWGGTGCVDCGCAEEGDLQFGGPDENGGNSGGAILPGSAGASAVVMEPGCWNTFKECNPLDPTSCGTEGDSCDYGLNGVRPGLYCFPPPNTQQLGELCGNPVAGPFCAPGLHCAGGRCAHMCCSDDDCALEEHCALIDDEHPERGTLGTCQPEIPVGVGGSGGAGSGGAGGDGAAGQPTATGGSEAVGGGGGSAGATGTAGAGGLAVAGAAGAAGMAGGAGQLALGGSAGRGGAAGQGGVAGSSAAAGSTGRAGAGAGGLAGSAGAAGTAGSAGAAGTSGAAGSAGQLPVGGAAGQGGTAGQGGVAGSATAGVAGRAEGGAGGLAGSAGTTP